jgi:hypothetical protein
MPEITFIVDLDTGKSELMINGILNKACEPIHAAFSSDLERIAGVKETSVTATPDKAKPAKYTTVSTNTVRR